MLKTSLQFFLLMTVSLMVIAQKKEEATQKFSNYFTPDKKYLVLPVKNSAPKRYVELWVDGVKSRYFDIELAEEQADWNAYLQIDQ